MNSLAGYTPSRTSDHPCPELMAIAERELSAFFTAVTRLFGSEQAELSADDWLRELIESDALPASTDKWRLVTAKASTRLASRIAASSLSTEPQLA